MEQVWRQAPTPAVRVRDGAAGSRCELNDAALQWQRDRGLSLPDIEQLVGSLQTPGDADRWLGAEGHRVRCRVVALDDGRLVWFVPDAVPQGDWGDDRALIERALYMSDVSVWWVEPGMQRIHFIRRGSSALGSAGNSSSVPLEYHRAQMHPDDVDGIARAARLALAENDRVADAMVRYALPAGGWRTLLTRRVAHRDAAGQLLGLLGISIDLSDLVAERARSLRLTEHMRLAAETIGLGFWSRNFDSGEAEWDDQMYRLHHRRPEEGPPEFEEWLDRHVHPDDRDGLREHQRDGSADWPQVDDVVFRVPHPGSEAPRWIHARSRRLLKEGQRVAVGVHVDVTEQHLAGLALERERERIRLVLEAAGVGVWERRLDGGPSYLSDVGFRLRGREPSTLALEDVLSESIDPADQARFRSALARQADAAETFRHEYRVRWPNGEQRWLASFGRAVRDAAGGAAYVAGVDIDITERRQAEAMARETARAEQASRAKTEFLARMSHELRTPLNAILGFGQLMQHDADEALSPRQRERLQRIETASRKLLTMIDEVLELTDEAGPRDLALESVGLADLLSQCLRQAEPAARAAGVRLRAGALTGEVWADRARLQRVLLQLIDNAIRYNWSGGEVELGSRPLAQDDQPGWVITVADTGRGMSPEQLSAAFQPFQRLGIEKEGIDGSGIGLTLARRHLDLMSARLDVSSRVGEGSAFRIWLPAAKTDAVASRPALAPGDQPARSLDVPGLGKATPPMAGAAALPAESVVAPRQPAPAPGSGGGIRLLCVEDNPVNMLLLREVFGMRPALRLQLCEDAATALAMAPDFDPDVVLLDLQLPDLPGVEVMRRLRADARHSRCRIIALSANAMPDDVRAAREAGFDDYWTKPIDVRRFLAAIDALVAAQVA